MSTKRFKQILPASKFALSPESDTFSSILLDSDMREIPEVETGENILVEDVFEDERSESGLYRVSAQLDMLVLIDDPYIQWNGIPQPGSDLGELHNPTHGCGGTESVLDPIYNGQANFGASDIYPQINDKNEENNWFVKVLYPESYLPNDTRISFSSEFGSGQHVFIQGGLPIVGVNFVEIDSIIYPCFITETDVQLEPDDYIYIADRYINMSTVPVSQARNFGEKMTGFHRVIYSNVNATSFNLLLSGTRPSDKKTFIIDFPIENVNKLSTTQLSTMVTTNPHLYAILNNLGGFEFRGSYKRTIGVSKIDVDGLSGSTFILLTTATSFMRVDEDGTPNPAGQYTEITAPSPHGLGVGFYVELQNLNAASSVATTASFNGIFRVATIPLDASTQEPSTMKFIIDGWNLRNAPSIQYRAVDAIASDYKIRMFKELTGIDDYILDRTAFATNMFGDQSYLINMTKDINTDGLTDYLDRPLSELFLGFIKRAGSLGYDWSNVVSHYSHIVRGIEGHLIEPGDTVGDPGYAPIPGVLPLTSYGTTNPNLISYQQTTFPLERTYNITDYPSNRVDATNINTNSVPEVISADYHYGSDTTSDGRYLGDLVEYNRGELSERTISDIFHRFNTTWRAFGYGNMTTAGNCWDFGSSYEGLFYKPFHLYPIRKWAAAIEAATPPASQPADPFPGYTESIQFEGVPYYAEEVQGLKIWRDLLDPGVLDDEGTIDQPFLNGTHYLYENIKLTLRRQTPGRSSYSRWNKLNKYFDSSNQTYTPNDIC